MRDSRCSLQDRVDANKEAGIEFLDRNEKSMRSKKGGSILANAAVCGFDLGESLQKNVSSKGLSLKQRQLRAVLKKGLQDCRSLPSSSDSL